MWWLYKVSYDTRYYYDVVGYSCSEVTPGALLSWKANIFLVEKKIMIETRKADAEKM